MRGCDANGVQVGLRLSVDATKVFRRRLPVRSARTRYNNNIILLLYRIYTRRTPVRPNDGERDHDRGYGGRGVERRGDGDTRRMQFVVNHGRARAGAPRRTNPVGAIVGPPPPVCVSPAGRPPRRSGHQPPDVHAAHEDVTRARADDVYFFFSVTNVTRRVFYAWWRRRRQSTDSVRSRGRSTRGGCALPRWYKNNIF